MNISLHTHTHTHTNLLKTRCTSMITYILFTNPSARAGYETRSIFKRSLTGLNSEISFSLTSCLTKAEETSLSYYLPIAGGRIIGFISFPRVLVLCEMQSVSSRVWTCVTVSISYDDNHYTTGTPPLHDYFYPSHDPQLETTPPSAKKMLTFRKCNRRTESKS